MQGPKLRVGTFQGDAVMLKKGAEFVFDDDKTPGDEHRVYLPHPEILAALEPGHTLLLDDGKVRLTAIETSPGAPSPGSKSAASSRHARA